MATAVVSMLHEDAVRNSAARQFRGEPVLSWTLARATRAGQLDNAVVICWDDQVEAVKPIAAEAGADVIVKSPRGSLPALDLISAAQRWADGWRGGLLGTCFFDRGFNAADACGAPGELVALIDPSAGLIDPLLIDAVIEHAQAHVERDLFFTQAAPGLAPVVLRRALVERLAKANAHPGRLLSYWPDTPGRDPMTTDMCIAVPPAIARTTQRLALDSARQIRRIEAATAALNGQLVFTEAERLVGLLGALPPHDPSPREIVLEINTDRASRAIFAPGTRLDVSRPPMTRATAARFFAQLRDVDDLRLTIGGCGDPLLNSDFAEIVNQAIDNGIRAIHVETDLIEMSEHAMAALLRVDVVSVNLPAITPQTYTAMMGADAYTRVIENLKRLIARRRGTPIIVPTFVKCRENLTEMETWYDYWLRAIGAAVITGASDFAGQIAHRACADMSPPKRRSCSRIDSRMTILSDATVASCEQDALCVQPMGNARDESISDIWNKRLESLRADHAHHRLEHRPLCSKCIDWHRP